MKKTLTDTQLASWSNLVKGNKQNEARLSIAEFFFGKDSSFYFMFSTISDKDRQYMTLYTNAMLYSIQDISKEAYKIVAECLEIKKSNKQKTIKYPSLKKMSSDLMRCQDCMLDMSEATVGEIKAEWRFLASQGLL